MTAAELQTIKDRVTKTICNTWRGDVDGDGDMVCVIEGRISADDFMKLCAAVDQEREACARLASKLGDSLTGDCSHRNGMDPETGEQLCARRDGCQCAEIIDCADAIAGKIRTRATT